MKVNGTFNGTGAAVYICIGFVPRRVFLQNTSDGTNLANVLWTDDFRSTVSIDGYRDGVVSALTRTAFTTGLGIQPYAGGDVLTAANQTSVGYGEGVYLGPDLRDYRYSNAKIEQPGDGSGDTINTWTLDTPGNRTGHFNADVVGGYIGAGSRILINGIWYTISTLTAGQGISADEVLLNRRAASGVVEFITGKWNYAPIALGKVTPAGFIVNETVVNANNGQVYFEAED